MHARGTFEVQLAPLPADDDSAAGFSGRMSIVKQFAGDIVGTGQGQMLTAMTDQPNSAGYVAIETVVGSVGGKTGSFVLQHSSTMNRGEPRQSVTVVPDSGTGELAGLTGHLTIDIVDDRHRYDFEYSIEAP